MHNYQQVAIVKSGLFLLALELYTMESKALAARFAHETLL
jgi:hypothetical protein